MPPKQKVKTTDAKGPAKNAKKEKKPDVSEKQSKTDDGDYMGQTFEQDYYRCSAFIEKLIDRLTNYGEDYKTLHAAYQGNTDLPKPQPKTTEYKKQIEKLTKRNQELDKNVEKLTKQKSNLSRPPSSTSTYQRSDKTDHQKESENDTETLKENLQESTDELKKARKELKVEKTAKEILLQEKDDLNKKCQTLKDQVKAMADLQKENEDLKAKLNTRREEHQEENATAQKSNNQSNSEEEELQRENSALTRDKKRQEDEIQTLQRKTAVMEADIESKRKEIERLQNNKPEPTSDSQEKKKEQEMEREKSALMRNKGRTEEMERMQKEKSDLTKNYEKKKKELESLQKENVELIKVKENQSQKILELQGKIKDLRSDNQVKKNGGGKPDTTSPGDKVKKLEDEVDSLRNRLSKMAGAQLTDNNPAIADLSDPNRPLSLGEKFSELYDNEWTDAMEEMAEKMSDETKVIKLLLDIVIDAYKFCLDKSDKFMEKINGTLSDFSKELSSSQTMAKEIAKANKDYRKNLAVYVVSCLQQDFTKEASTKAKTNVGDKTEAYMKKCVLVCWFMTVQDPKVCITTEKPEMFDEDLYKPYTKKGKRMDYLVWPVLHLHEGGPLIGKGVAQGK